MVVEYLIGVFVMTVAIILALQVSGLLIIMTPKEFERHIEYIIKRLEDKKQ